MIWIKGSPGGTLGGMDSGGRRFDERQTVSAATRLEFARNQEMGV